METFFETREKLLSDRKWVEVDASGKVLGRLATEVATILRGKNNPRYSPHHDSGDFVVVVNADKIKLTGTKFADKVYYRHTGYVGGVKSETAAELLARKPEEIIKKAVKRMLPGTTLGLHQFKKLRVYAGGEHPHSAQLNANSK